MKRICRLLVLALLVSLFQTGFVSANTPSSDVTDPAMKAAVDKLASYGIVNGKSDGKYHPEDNITRDQFAKMLVESLGMGAVASAAAGKTQFSDVAEDKWSSGYISVAVQQGLVRGRPDGTFGPNENVRYAEAVTMAMRALGYQDDDLQGSWPMNYLAKADDLHLLNGVSQDDKSIASRGTAAVLLSNTLDAPVVKGVTYDANGKPVFALDSTGTLASKLVKDGGSADTTPVVPASPATQQGSHNYSAGSETIVPTFTVSGTSASGPDFIYLNFSIPMDTSTLNASDIGLGTRLRLQYSDDKGNTGEQNMSLTNATGGWVSNQRLVLQLNDNFDKIFIPASKFLGVTLASTVTSAYGIPVSTAEVYSDAVPAEEAKPHLASWGFNTEDRLIELTFNEPVDANAVSVGAITITNSAVSTSVTLTTGTPSASMSNEVRVQVSDADMAAIKSNGLAKPSSRIELATGAVKDLVGNQSNAHSALNMQTYSSDVRLDASAIALTNGGIEGKIEDGDKIILTFTKSMSPAAIGTDFDVSVSSANSSVITVKKHGTEDVLATITAENQQYASGGGITFNSSTGVWGSNDKSLTITLAGLTGGSPATGVSEGISTFKLGNLAIDAEGVSGENYSATSATGGF